MILNFSNQKVLHKKNMPKVFLAGPTIRDSSFHHSWRMSACNMFEDHHFNGILYIPEFDRDHQRDYLTQVLWEREALSASDIIMFWVDRNMNLTPGMTTNVEFGAWTESHPEKVWLGYPSSSEKMDYLDWFFRFKTKREPYDNLENMIKDIINSL